MRYRSKHDILSIRARNQALANAVEAGEITPATKGKGFKPIQAPKTVAPYKFNPNRFDYDLKKVQGHRHSVTAHGSR